jgi:hypothetical protein
MKPIYRRVAVVFALTLVCGSAALAQSGRRSTGGSKSPTQTPTPVLSGTKPAVKTHTDSQKVQLLVGVGTHDVMSIPTYVSDTVLDSFMRRLEESTDVLAQSGGHNITRADAIKAAKLEVTRYVVWLQVGSELADSGRQVGSGQDPQLYVAFTIFEPQTAKARQSGRTHPAIYGRGVLIPRTGGSVLDYAARQAGRDAADRVLASFDIKLRNVRYSASR